MAKKDSSEETTQKLLWLLGGAVITGTVMWSINKHLNEREELNRLRASESNRKELKSGNE